MQETPTNITLLSIPEAAAKLSICRRMYYRLVQLGELPPPLKIGGKSLVPLMDVTQFILRKIEARG